MVELRPASLTNLEADIIEPATHSEATSLSIYHYHPPIYIFLL